MNKRFLVAVLIIFQGGNLAWGASYLLHLKNGSELRTSHYWEEGGEIKFYAYGGVAGIQKSSVIKVTTLNINSKDDISFQEDKDKARVPIAFESSKSQGISQSQISEKEEKFPKDSGKNEAVNFEYYREKKAILKEKLEEALQKNREAITRQDLEARESTRQEYLEFSKQIMDLGGELKRRNKGVLPDWWNE